MSFLDDVRGEGYFLSQATKSLSRASTAFDKEFSNMLSPYHDLTSHRKSLAHPFYHATQLLRDVARLGYGTLVFAGALATGNFSNAGLVLEGILKVAAAAVVEVLNTLVAVVSLVTCLLSSAFNLGYVTTNLKSVAAQMVERTGTSECSGRNEATIANMFGVFSISLKNVVSQRSDESIHQAAFSLV